MSAPLFKFCDSIAFREPEAARIDEPSKARASEDPEVSMPETTSERSYKTPLLLGTPFTLRLGATAIATARAKALKMLSRQWWLSLP